MHRRRTHRRRTHRRIGGNKKFLNGTRIKNRVYNNKNKYTTAFILAGLTLAARNNLHTKAKDLFNDKFNNRHIQHSNPSRDINVDNENGNWTNDNTDDLFEINLTK
jgi:hypothetical protein